MLPDDARIVCVIADSIERGKLDHPGFYRDTQLGEVLRRVLSGALAARQPVRHVPAGFVLVPEKFGIPADVWEGVEFVIGGPGTGEGEAYLDSTAWIGDLMQDDGSSIFGLHLSCDQCPEDGSVTLAEFAATPAQAVGTQPLGCTECPVTGLPFYDNMEHPERGLIAMYGGPLDVYSVPELQDNDGQLRRERYDLDADCWVEGGEPLGYFYREQQPVEAQVTRTVEQEDDGDKECSEAFEEFADEYLTDGNGYAPASTYEACWTAFKAAWPFQRAAVEMARDELKRLHGDDISVGARHAEVLNRVDAREADADVAGLHEAEVARLRAEVEGLRKDAERLNYIERTFSGMTNRERYLPVTMIWGAGAMGRTLRQAVDKYMDRESETGASA